jgi:hypothetical protein
MTETTPNAVDVMRFTAARVMVRLTQARKRQDADALAILDDLHKDLTNALRRLCPPGQDPAAFAARYSDNRPVISAMALDDSGSGETFVYCWHWDCAHPANQRGEIQTVTAADGTRKRILVAAVGHLDSVSLPSIEVSHVPRVS